MLAQGRILVDGDVARDIQQAVNKFSQVSCDGESLQANKASYIMMNKPVGVLSSTKDAHHKTVIDLLGCSERHQLHLAGRLDFNSTGLLLLTNDGHWSRRLSSPENAVEKIYRVSLEKPLNETYIYAFAQGMYFQYENITTRPVRLKIISDRLAEVTLAEGRYHQIKRMFGRFQNKVLQLHRQSVGNIQLDPNLLPGQYRKLSAQEAPS